MVREAMEGGERLRDALNRKERRVPTYIKRRLLTLCFDVLKLSTYSTVQNKVAVDVLRGCIVSQSLCCPDADLVP